MSKKIIYGCEARGDAHLPYLTRYTLLSTPWFQLCVHVFHRSDADDLHDHPWNFWTLPLRHGYREYARTAEGGIELNEVKPWRLYFRAATYTHRVLLYASYALDEAGKLVVKKKEAVTLVLMLKRQREWGFHTQTGWQLWTDYFTAKGC